MEPISEQHPWTAFGAAESDWNDWRWQLKHALKSREELERFVRLTDSEVKGIEFAKTALPFQLTPHFLTLIDREDARCPLRRQVIPSEAEAVCHPGEFRDPLGEDAHSPVPGLVHKYETHVLLLVTDRCASYCRHCTRRRIAGGTGHRDENCRAELHAAPEAGFLPEAIDYIRRRTEIRDVLISGGDPFLLSDERLSHILEALRAIPHVQIIRIGTRTPAFLPMRVTEDLARMLRRFAPLYVVTHFNHVREITPASERACALLADHGIPLENQTVLLRGINSEARVLKALFEKLLTIRVRPYYLHQLDLSQGIEHFRTPLSCGVDILRALRGHTSGLAIPQLAVDLPMGFGKVTLSPDFTLRTTDAGTFFTNWQGKECPLPYPEPQDADASCPFEHRDEHR